MYRKLKPLGWARVTRTGAHILRRGAWYPVLNDARTNIIILEVGRRNVAVSRPLVQVRRHQPDRWSVVVRAPDELANGRAAALQVHAIYAVCPACRGRATLLGRPEHLRCPECMNLFSVAWDETC